METIQQVATITTHTGTSNNNDDSGINEPHEYDGEGEVFDIAYEITTEVTRSLIDSRNWERVS